MANVFPYVFSNYNIVELNYYTVLTTFYRRDALVMYINILKTVHGFYEKIKMFLVESTNQDCHLKQATYDHFLSVVP